MSNHTSRFVHDEEMIVLIMDFKWNIFCYDVGRGWLGYGNVDAVAGRNSVAWLDDLSIDKHEAILNRLLDF